VGANAFTIGTHIFFGSGAIGPALINHELQHVAEQQTAGKTALQRDVRAYNSPRSRTITAGPAGIVTGASSAEAARLRGALAKFIAAGSIAERSIDGDSVFGVPELTKASAADLTAALASAGVSNSAELAIALRDNHAEFLFADEKLTTIAGFSSSITELGERLTRRTERPLTQYEISEASRVFGNAIDYAKVVVAEGSLAAEIISSSDNAVTPANTIYFPVGGSASMSWLIHELTHVWQYQTTGWTFDYRSPGAWISGYEYAASGKTREQTLIAARKEGRSLQSFNREQQGDILRDYYKRLKVGQSTDAWQPFVDDVKGGSASATPASRMNVFEEIWQKTTQGLNDLQHW
jgi:hypothetical protein